MDLLPDTRVLMLTVSTDEDAVIQAVAAGATGYLQKHSGVEELLDALREVAGGTAATPSPQRLAARRSPLPGASIFITLLAG